MRAVRRGYHGVYPMLTPSYLECSLTGERYPAGQVHNLSRAGAPLLVRYPLEAIRRSWLRESLKGAPPTMWRYGPVLPVRDRAHVVTLGEGMTPSLRLERLGPLMGASDLWLKDDGINPTMSFKARGLACAISMCREFGITRVAIPSAGNAASALAAYAAAAGIQAFIFMPRDVPYSNYLECKAFGADVTLVDGLISDCGRIVAERKDQEGWFDVSTLKEPYRIEGKKTMGYEIAEQFGWELPDVILYPTGGGVGLIGMWKAFAELQQLAWIGSKRPRMVAVQAEGCQPVVRAFQEGASTTEFWTDAHTAASGLRVPKPLGDRLILQALRESKGTAVAVSDEEMIDAGAELARCEGVFAAPEGAACVAAVRKLLASGFLTPQERILIYNTGAGLKYIEAYQTRFPRTAASDQDKLGGLITPR
jgi:threonine synthase